MLANSSPPAATSAPYHVAFVLVPHFSMLAFTSAIEPLRAANLLSEQRLYSWELLSFDGGPVSASNSVRVEPDGAFSQCRIADAIIVCSGLWAERVREPSLVRWLKERSRRRIPIGAICTGALVLARAGLLDGYRCTVHWENVESFVEEFPNLQLTATLYEFDRDRFTCSGGTAPLDMMLYAIHERHGAELGIRVAEFMLHAVPRMPHDAQRLSLQYRTGLSHPKLLAVIAQMEAFLESPVSLRELGAGVGLSTRQLERLFQTHLGTTPKRYYLELRLKRARLLLRQTTMPILQVAVACGFTSPSHFAQAYGKLFLRSPRIERAALRLSDEIDIAAKRI